MRPRKLVVISAEELHRLADEGWLHKEVATHLGITPQALSRHIKRIGADPQWQRRYPSDRITREHLLLLVQKHDTQTGMAKELGIGRHTLLRLMEEHGVEKQWARGARLPRDYPALAEAAVKGGLLDGTRSRLNVAQTLGIAPQTLMRRVLPLIPPEQVAFWEREPSEKPPARPRRKAARSKAAEEPRRRVPDYGVRRVGGFVVPGGD